MPGFMPGIHVFTTWQRIKTWMAGTSPAMTSDRQCLSTVMPGLVPGIHVLAAYYLDGIDVLFAARQLAAAFGDLLSSANSAISARLMAACRVGELICAPIRSVT